MKYTSFGFFFFNDTATTEIYTLSLHDALPIFQPRTLRRAMMIALLAACTGLCGQERPRYTLPQVTIKGTSSESVEKSYRKMVRGMDYFEKARVAFAPDASLRFKLLPRKPGTDMDHIELEI